MNYELRTNLLDGNCGFGYWEQIKKKLVDMGLLKKLIKFGKIGGLRNQSRVKLVLLVNQFI